MGKSFKINAGGVTTAPSDKQGKKEAAKKLRAASKKAVFNGDENMPLRREVASA